MSPSIADCADGGFGHQQINVLCPADPGMASPAPDPRLYHPADMAQFQPLKQPLERSWIRLLRVSLARDRLPLLWDCDFIRGERKANETERYVLCEINVSSVSPFPASAIEPLVATVKERFAAPPP